MEKMPDEIYVWMGFQDNGSWDREPCVCDSHESVKYIRADLADLSPQTVPAQHSGAIDEIDEQVLARIYALDKLVEQAQELNMGYDTQTAAALEAKAKPVDLDFNATFDALCAAMDAPQQAAEPMDDMVSRCKIFIKEYNKIAQEGK